ncbi:type II toxin-antitoxin system RelE/ParE family toxin [Flavobacterium sp. XS1P32]|uniref:type II toxin-antitoxin system RelE/ParE family toxin n=1 Tax=Flavobacterium sp. XS1P32 TaxID=3401726 RepID=UPI003AAE9220
MTNSIYEIFWTTNAKLDLKDIYLSLIHKFSLSIASKVTDETFESINSITFPDQFQTDEYRIDCRRMITRNYKILYQFHHNKIYVIRIFNTFQDPIKSLR